MPWQIITRSRARRTGADATAGPSQATQAVLHEQARPSKRSRKRFAVLESDDVLRPESANAQPSCGASHPSFTAQDETTQTSPCIHTARPPSQPSLTSEPNAQNGAAAPQSPLTPDDDRAHIASQPRRSERIRANTLSQQIAATASHIFSGRQPIVVDQDETHDAIPSISDDCPQQLNCLQWTLTMVRLLCSDHCSAGEILPLHSSDAAPGCRQCLNTNSDSL